MFSTFDNFKQLASLHTGEKDLNKIALQYQATGEPVLLAYVYCKWFNFTCGFSNKYVFLTDSDKESYAVEELHKALTDFKVDGGAQLQTLYIRYLGNRLRSEAQSLNYHRRKANNLTYSMQMHMEEDDGEDNNTFESVLRFEDSRFSAIEMLDMIERNEQLTQNEVKYCTIAMDEDSVHMKDSDIAKLLGVSSAAVHYMKKSLQRKLVFA